MLKSLFVLTILTLLSWFFDHVGKQFNFKIYDGTGWTARNYIIYCTISPKVIDLVILEEGVTRGGKNWNHVFLLAIPLILMKQ